MTPAFPGMNPYLETPDLWTEVHAWLIVQLARHLNPILKPKYRAAVEQRVYTDSLLVGIPDVSVFQSKPRSAQTTTTLSKPIKVNLPMTVLEGLIQALNGIAPTTPRKNDDGG